MTERFELNGRHAFAIFFAFFAVIIAVNMVLAVSAARTFPGLETDRNGYIASQSFERDRAAQEALGWTVAVSHDGGLFRLTVTGADGGPVRPAIDRLVIGRPTMAADDRQPELKWTGEAFEAPVSLAPGKWIVHLRAHAPDGTGVRKRFTLWVKG